jgi:hypothetical protein
MLLQDSQAAKSPTRFEVFCAEQGAYLEEKTQA